MNKKEFIEKFGGAAWEKKLQQRRDRYVLHREDEIANTVEWREKNPDKIEAIERERTHKGGKKYGQMLKYQRTGIRGDRHVIRATHGRQYRPFKKIIAPDSQIHHEWRAGTADFMGVALVEKDQHQHGYIDVIQILEGEITLLTEM
jgi:hypothetical protein